jgi:hypothetical protein
MMGCDDLLERNLSPSFNPLNHSLDPNYSDLDSIPSSRRFNAAPLPTAVKVPKIVKGSGTDVAGSAELN